SRVGASCLATADLGPAAHLAGIGDNGGKSISARRITGSGDSFGYSEFDGVPIRCGAVNGEPFPKSSAGVAHCEHQVFAGLPLLVGLGCHPPALRRRVVEYVLAELEDAGVHGVG